MKVFIVGADARNQWICALEIISDCYIWQEYGNWVNCSSRSRTIIKKSSAPDTYLSGD